MFASHLFIEPSPCNRRFILKRTAETNIFSHGGYKKTVTDLFVDQLPPKLTDAIRAAYEYAKVAGLDFKAPKDGQFPDDLSAITRAKQAVRSSAKQKKLDQQAAVEKARQDRRTASEQSLENGIYPFGKHIDQKIESQPGYAQWLVEKKATFDKGSILEYAAGVIERKFQHLLKVETPYESGHRPEADKSRIQIKGTVLKAMSFASDFGRTYWIFIKDEKGLCIVAKGGWWADEGTEVNVSATIKAKETYKGQDQTIVNRVK